MCLKMLTNVPKNRILLIYVYWVILKNNLFYISVYWRWPQIWVEIYSNIKKLLFQSKEDLNSWGYCWGQCSFYTLKRIVSQKNHNHFLNGRPLSMKRMYATDNR